MKILDKIYIFFYLLLFLLLFCCVCFSCFSPLLLANCSNSGYLNLIFNQFNVYDVS